MPGDVPVPALVSVGIDSHTARTSGEILVSPQLATDREVDEAVDGLIAELEQIRRDAKARIRADKAKVNAGITQRMRERDEQRKERQYIKKSSTC